MIRKKDQYFSLCRILLLTIGLWPYQQSNFVTFQYISISTLLITFVIFQLTTFFTLNCTSELFMKILSSTSFRLFFVIKYCGFHFNIEDVKDLLMQLQQIYNELKDKNEVAIIKKYDYIAKRYTIGITIYAGCLIFALIIIQFWKNIAHIDLPMNISRPYQFLFTIEYFIDQNKYFYLILLHINVTIWFGTTTVVAIGTLIITYYLHICGMFQIVCYRIDHAININFRQTVVTKNKFLTEGIICAVKIHRQAVKLARHFVSVMEIMLCCMIACGVVSLSLNLFQIASSTNDIEECLMPFGFASALIVYMFLSNFTGQIVTDHNNHVFITAYNVQWYETPLHVQRMMLFLFQLGTKEFILNVFGLYDASIEGFATLLKASISYFTVIHSTR